VPASTEEGTSNLAPLLWLGGGVIVTAIFLARWAYVRRRSRGAWPPTGRD
jgi:hypothetical protein